MKYCITICIINTFICNTSKLVVGEHLTMFDQIMNFTQTPTDSAIKFLYKHSKTRECSSKECTEASYRITKNMNVHILPCTDFYKFTCGDFAEYKLITQEEYMVNSMSEIANQHQKELKVLFENVNADNFTVPFNSAKRFYSDCMSLDYKNEKTLQKMHHRINVRNGWPLLMDSESLEVWDDMNYHWLGMVIASIKEGISADYLFKLSVEVDPFKRKEYILAVDQPKLEFSQEIFHKFRYMPYEIQQYYFYMIDVAVIFGADRDRATTDLLATLQFEYELSKILLPKESVLNLRDRRNRFSLTDLHHLTPNIDWPTILNSYVNESIVIDYDEVIIVKSIQYLEELDMLITNSPREVVANYLIWKMISQSAPFINDELRVLTSEYRKMFRGELRRKPLWLECLDVTKQFFPGIINALVAYNNRPETLISATDEIFEQLQTSMDEGLNYTWIYDNESRLMVKYKLNSITYNFGFPMDYDDEQALLEYYGVSMYSGNYFDSMLLITRRHREFHIKRYRNSDIFDYDDQIKRLNMPLYGVSYHYFNNEISFGVGILNSLSIDTNVPYYSRFAGIGVIIGRLISEIYSEMGMNFGKEGAFDKWCSRNCEQPFVQQAECVNAQYNNFMQTSKSLWLGNLTEHRNIADIDGIRIAYRAYVRWIHHNGEEIRLPGLGYTNTQLFWIWYANMHCSRVRSEAYNQLIESGDDVDPKFRVNGPVVNIPYFANDFECDTINFQSIKGKCEVS